MSEQDIKIGYVGVDNEVYVRCTDLVQALNSAGREEFATFLHDQMFTEAYDKFKLKQKAETREGSCSRCQATEAI